MRELQPCCENKGKTSLPPPQRVAAIKRAALAAQNCRNKTKGKYEKIKKKCAKMRASAFVKLIVSSPQFHLRNGSTNTHIHTHTHVCVDTHSTPYMLHGVSHQVDRQSEFGCAIMFAVRKNLAGCAQHEVELNHRWHIISAGPGNGDWQWEREQDPWPILWWLCTAVIQFFT